MAKTSTPNFFTHAIQGAGLLLGAILIAQGALGLLWPSESLLFLLWSLPTLAAAPVALLAGAGLILAYTNLAYTHRARLAALLITPGVLVALWDTFTIWKLGLTSPTVELTGLAWWPSSLMLALALTVPAVLALHQAGWRNPSHNTPRPRSFIGYAAAFAFAGLLLVSMILHAVMATGHTNYQRSADTAVILGARAYKNHTPSDALRDRIMTGVDLYKQGRVRRLLMTGGMSAKIISEAKVMKRYAMAHGVPARAIILDEEGDNTAASIRNLTKLKKKHNLGKLLVVSHDHHTLRLKLSCHRLGLTCYTVPATQERRLKAEPYYIAREVAGVVHYALFFR